MNFTEFTVRLSRGEHFPDIPAVMALKHVVRREFGTSIPAVLAGKLQKEKRKKR